MKIPTKKSNAKRAYLKPISITPGQFSSEKAIELQDYREDRFSGFFQNKYIKNDILEVIVLQEKDGLALIKLPGRLLEEPACSGSGCYLTIKKSDLKYI